MRNYQNNRMLPRDELKKVERRLPDSARAALRRMRNDARNAKTLGEGKWRTIGVADIEERYALRVAYERTELVLSRTVGNSDEMKYALEPRNEAREALAAFDTNRNIRLEQIRALQNRTEGGLIENCERFLSGCQHAQFKEYIASIPAGDLSKAFARTREAITKKYADIESEKLAPVTLEEATAHIDHDIQKFAQAGRPDIYATLRYEATNANTRQHGYTRWPEVWTGTGRRKIQDGFALVLWALKDQIRERLVAEAKERIESSAFASIAIADREPREIQLRAELLELERTEEAVIAALQAKGDANVVRRHNADPRALLGIEVVLTEIEHLGSGSLVAQYEPPKMVTPSGQKLPRDSAWLNQGPRNADIADD
jgi:hypothetical protein